MACPRCGGVMRVVAFLTEHAVVDRIIDHLRLTFVAERPPPPDSIMSYSSDLGQDRRH